MATLVSRPQAARLGKERLAWWDIYWARLPGARMQLKWDTTRTLLDNSATFSPRNLRDLPLTP